MTKNGSLDHYIDLALDEEKANYTSKLEPFETYSAKFRERVHQQLNDYKQHFLYGYTLLAPVSTNNQAMEKVNSFEKMVKFIALGNSLCELFGYSVNTLSELYSKAYQMIANKHYQDGLDAYFFIVTVAPNFREAWLNFGFCLCKRKNYLEGIEAFGKAFELDPTKADAYLAAAGAYLKLHDKPSALAICDYGINKNNELVTRQLQEAKTIISRQ